jgi:CRP-like cAMP-binding protein
MITTNELRKATGLTSDLGAHHVTLLAALAHRVEFLPGETIFHQGEKSNWFYFLLSGEVELELNASGEITPVQKVNAGEEFGWSSLFGMSKALGEFTKHFTARARTPVAALAFDGSDLRTAFRQDPEFGFRFMRRLLAVATERLDATRMELVRASMSRAEAQTHR